MDCGIRRILQFEFPIQYSDIKVIDNLNNDVTLTCMYSWSMDGVCWTNWVNYHSYQQICGSMEGDFFFRILLFTGLSKVYQNGLVTTCYHISLDTTNQFLLDFCGNENLFNPYVGLDCALLLQEQLANSIVCMFGIPVYYIRTKPQRDTADYTFKEYVMYNVESIKKIQLIIPDGTMPSSKPQFSDMDFDWEVGWDVEIGKDQFARAFGDTAFPKMEDYIYIPLMKRMWDVNAAYDEKSEGLMWRSTTWKLALVKHNDSTNVETEGFDNILDQWTSHTYEKVFGELEANEQERLSAVRQLKSPNTLGNNIYTDISMEDAVRQSMTKPLIRILTKQMNQRSVLLAKNIYRFSNKDAGILYQEGICGENGTLSFILETPGQYADKHDILSFGEIVVTMDGLTMKFGDMHQELKPFTTYIVQLVWNRNNFTSELNIYEYKHLDVPVAQLRPEMYSFDFEHPACEQTSSYNNDYIQSNKRLCQVSGDKFSMTNIRLYNTPLPYEERIREACKYTTTNPSCVFNDVARPLDNGVGYTAK